MHAKVSVYIATTIDGFIARKDGELNWLNSAAASMPADEDCGYRAFMKTVDVLIMGRKTYEKVASFDAWPYGQTPVVVLSRHAITFPAGLPNCVTHSSEEPRALYDRLSREGARHLYVDGGVTVQRFLAEGLIDELTITLVPVILGEGTPLFGPLAKDVPLKYIGSSAFEFGFVQIQYAVIKDS